MNSVGITRIFIALLIIAAASCWDLPRLQASERPSSGTVIDHWEIKRQTNDQNSALEDIQSDLTQWETVSQHSVVGQPGEILWIRLQLPDAQMRNRGLFVEDLYGSRVDVYQGSAKVFESNRNFGFDVNQVLIPLDPDEDAIWIKVSTLTERIGIGGSVRVDDYSKLVKSYIRKDIDDLALGSAFLFVSVIMLVFSVFLPRNQRLRWSSLAIILLSLGTMVLTYSSVLHTLVPRYGHIYHMLYDVSLLTLLPAFTFFFEKSFDHKHKKLLKGFRYFQIAYSLFCGLATWINNAADNRYFKFYFFVTVTLLGITMLLQLVLLIVLSIRNALNGDRNALIFAGGFVWLGLLSVGELLWYYVAPISYDLHLWKWGVVGFVLSLMIILGRRIADDHHKLVSYSKELETFSHYLQKHEKLEIISELTASVAHEVRNPLQVTRGFLQLLGARTENKEKMYVNLALSELDRASEIITDFLTFAKPQLDDWRLLKLVDELRRIESTLAPMAGMQGVSLRLETSRDLYIRGNSAKLKQAMINIIKNSIESLKTSGAVYIRAYRQGDEVFIHVKDNGQGMTPEEVARLGEPYFSNKTKGTGLGLMVTFRIVEVMQGRIEYRSEKGIGTEAILSFPAAEFSEETGQEEDEQQEGAS